MKYIKTTGSPLLQLHLQLFCAFIFQTTGTKPVVVCAVQPALYHRRE